jgi:precorrin-6Y C5,15-methyltransferase (decarboxylating)
MSMSVSVGVNRPVVIVGIGADGLPGLSPRARAAIESATFLAGGERHLDLVGPPPIKVEVERFTIRTNLPELVDRLRARRAEERCVVLASGDPLFYGIGHLLGQSLGTDQIVVEPSLSSLQLAFARAGVSWHDAAVATVHGRPLQDALLPILGKPKVGLFTQGPFSPSAVASFLIGRGLSDYDAIVGENLGAENEHVWKFPLPELVGREFAPLNVLILLRHSGAIPEPDLTGASAVGIPDALFAQPEAPPILLTHADVRAIVVGRFWGLPSGPLWDIGAGLGGVAVSLARGFPTREIVAVERSADQAAYLHTNRLRFGAYNMRVVFGTAPACLEGEADPAGVFLGGSGGALEAILDRILRCLVPRGILVANFVGLENLGQCLKRLREAGWPFQVTEASISRSQNLAGLTTLVPDRPVWVVRAGRP